MRILSLSFFVTILFTGLFANPSRSTSLMAAENHVAYQKGQNFGIRGDAPIDVPALDELIALWSFLEEEQKMAMLGDAYDDLTKEIDSYCYSGSPLATLVQTRLAVGFELILCKIEQEDPSSLKILIQCQSDLITPSASLSPPLMSLSLNALSLLQRIADHWDLLARSSDIMNLFGDYLRNFSDRLTQDAQSNFFFCGIKVDGSIVGQICNLSLDFKETIDMIFQRPPHYDLAYRYLQAVIKDLTDLQPR